MLSIPASTPIYLYSAPTDMRKGFNGLCGLIEAAADADAGEALRVTDGALFVFVNRIRDRVKVLHFDGDGLAIWYKQLEAGRFELPASCHPSGGASDRVTLDATQLRLILDGIDLASVKRRKRYVHRGESPPPPDGHRHAQERDPGAAVAA